MELAEVIRLLQKNKNVETIVQFGSSISMKKYNDIDLCIFTVMPLSLQEKLILIRELPELFDVCFFEDLPLHIKKRVCSGGKVLFTRDYYHFLTQMRIVELEYPYYGRFLQDYAQKRFAEV